MGNSSFYLPVLCFGDFMAPRIRILRAAAQENRMAFAAARLRFSPSASVHKEVMNIGVASAQLLKPQFS